MKTVLSQVTKRLELSKTDTSWFDSLTDEQQETYLKEHPGSAYHDEAFNGKTNFPKYSKKPWFSKIKDRNRDGSTPLHEAAYYHKDALKHPDVSKIKDKNGDTPLHNAATSENARIRNAAKSILMQVK
jgi:ankyrin repeat protein